MDSSAPRGRADEERSPGAEARPSTREATMILFDSKFLPAPTPPSDPRPVPRGR